MLKKILLTLWFWLVVIIATAITGILSLLVITSQVLYMIFFPPHKLFDLHDIITMIIENVMAGIIYECMVGPGFWKVIAYTTGDIEMKDLQKGRYILAPNHISIIDTLLIAMFSNRKTYTFNMKWAWVPLFGQLCLLAGYVGISSGNKSTVVEKISQKVEKGYSVMIYPEGTRSKNSDLLQPLKTGAFRIAQNTKTPVLPITFNGTVAAVDRYGLVNTSVIKIAFGEPINVDSDEGGIQRAMEKYKKTMERNMNELKK
jgi:1-acyl-sn-glycerol-3-phosphate acyltransferase